MSESNKASPTTLVLMAAGIVICVGLVIHEVSSGAFGPQAAVPAQHSSVTAAAVPKATAGVVTPGAGPIFPAPQPGVVTEAELAPNADPFTPIGGWSVAATTPVGQAAAIPAPPVAGGLPVGPQKMQTMAPGTLAGFGVQEPELVGTLLGDKPSAVFRIEQRIVTVAQGAQIIGWKVVSIQQGAAVLQGMGRTIRLSTGKSGIASAAGKMSTSMNSQAEFLSQAKVTSEPESRSEAGSAAHISVAQVEMAAAQADQSTLPKRTPGYRISPDTSEDANRVVVSGPFVNPLPQLSVPLRNSREEDAPMPSRIPYPEPIQVPVEQSSSISGSQAGYDASPNQSAGPGPRPRRHRRLRHTRRHKRNASAFGRRSHRARHHKHHG